MKFVFIFLLGLSFVWGQLSPLNVANIPEELKENSYSVVRNENLQISIEAVDKMTIDHQMTITVFNESGLSNVDARAYYDPSTKIKSFEVTVYDKNGDLIKKLNKNDFIDQSVADGYSIIGDNRVLFLHYTPIQYPITFVCHSKVSTSNTAFIRPWYPLNDYHESIEKASCTITFPPTFKWNKKITGNITFIKEQEIQHGFSYTCAQVRSIKDEPYAPKLDMFVPIVYHSMSPFSLEGVQGAASNWDEFGTWVNDKLLSGTDDLPESTKSAVINMVKDLPTPLEKAKKIYEYVQSKTRYVSVQLGIGGWKPMKASEVDRLGYGDCKALTNYTACLLHVAGIPAYYTLVNAGEDKEKIDKEIIRIQGNHAFLTIPISSKNYFLECTSQTHPFGYQGDFTDNRTVLMIKPDGAQFVESNGGQINSNRIESTHQITIDQNGTMNAQSTIVSKGIQYKYSNILPKQSAEKIQEHYNKKLSYIRELSVDSYQFSDRRDDYEFEEKVTFHSTTYWQAYEQLKAFIPTVMNRLQDIPVRIRSRKLPFYFDRDQYLKDTYVIHLPANSRVHFCPANSQIETAFGTYSIQYERKGTDIVCTRIYELKAGMYEPSKFEAFRNFKEQVVAFDNQKILLNP